MFFIRTGTPNKKDEKQWKINMNNNLQAIILAAGKSSRFNTQTTKLAQFICGQAMILFPTKLLEQLQISTTIVVGYQQEIIRDIITKAHGDSIEFVVQEQQNGTGHALASTQSSWKNDHILVLNGDVPLISSSLITSLYNEHIKSNATISFVTSLPTDNSAHAYGRIVKTANRIAIIEAKDFTHKVQDHPYINAGIYLINKNFLQNYIATLNDNNANKEFYITDLIKIASDNNLIVTTIDTPFDTIRGVNTFQELSTIEHIAKSALVNYWMNNGVRFANPQLVHIDLNVNIGSGSFIGTGVHITGNTIIGKNCIIKEFSSLENVIMDDESTVHSHSVISSSYIQTGAHVGPFAHIRTNSTIGAQSVIGNFVEVKNSIIGTNTKAKHLTYLGDAIIGSCVNIGAGTITCNFDGIAKHKTIIEDNAFIGSNNTLVAPITIGNDAFTAAGSTITVDVPQDALAIARSHQTNKNDYAKKLKKAIAAPHKQKPDLDEFSFIGARLIHPDNHTDET